MARFQLKSKILKQTLSKMRVALKSTALNKRTVYCEITITYGKVTLTCPGVTYTIDAETEGTAKAALPLLYLINILQDHKAAEIEVAVNDNWLHIGNLKVAAKTTFLQNDRILRSVNLTLNFNDADLLKMPDQGFTKEELEFNRLDKKFHSAKNQIQSNIGKAFMILNKYGITYNEIEDLVKSKLNA